VGHTIIGTFSLASGVACETKAHLISLIKSHHHVLSQTDCVSVCIQ